MFINSNEFANEMQTKRAYTVLLTSQIIERTEFVKIKKAEQMLSNEGYTFPGLIELHVLAVMQYIRTVNENYPYFYQDLTLSPILLESRWYPESTYIKNLPNYYFKVSTSVWTDKNATVALRTFERPLHKERVGAGAMREV